MKTMSKQPILILDGFLINKNSYFPMQDILSAKLSVPVNIVSVTKYEWLRTSGINGWKSLLDKVEENILY